MAARSHNTSGNRGFSLVEVLVGSAILVLVLVAFTSSLSLFSQASENATNRAQALFLAQESIEVLRGLRDESWSSHIAPQSPGTEYGLSFDGSSWQIESSPQMVDGFERSVVFEQVFRDSNDDIADSGTEDAQARLITAEVTWNDGADSLTLETVLTNLFEN